MKIRKHLSASGLYKLVRTGFSQIEDQRTEDANISLQDTLMSGFALFSLRGCFSKQPLNDTAWFADVVLPEASYLERYDPLHVVDKKSIFASQSSNLRAKPNPLYGFINNLANVWD